jgi:hypothetical protein
MDSVFVNSHPDHGLMGCYPMLDRRHVINKLTRRKLLIAILSSVLLGGLLWSYEAFTTASKSRHPLPDTPVVVHRGDCVWIIDGDAAVLTHGPYCFSGFWRQVGIGDVEVASSGHLYVSFHSERSLDLDLGKTVADFDPTTAKKIDEITTPIRPNDLARLGNGLLYVGVGDVSAGGSGIAVIDMETNAIVGEIALDLPCDPERVVPRPERKLYVSSCWSLAKIDTGTNSVSYCPTEFRPKVFDMALGSDGYLYLLLSNEIRIIDPDTWTAIAGTGQDSDLTACSGLQLATAGRKAFVTCHDKQAMVVYDAASDAITSISLPDWYSGIAAVSNGKLYLIQKDAENVLVLDTQSGETLTEIPLPKG